MQEPSTRSLAPVPTIRVTTVELVVIGGPDTGKRARVVAKGRAGTSAGCELRLSDPTASRVHCEIRVAADGVRVVDGGSTNGTIVDGVDVRDARLRAGSILSLGATRVRVDFAGKPTVVPLSPRERFGGLVGSSTVMRQCYAIMERVAPTTSTVLIEGETGTGKEVAARAIHDASSRSAGPFVAVDCGAIAEHLFESELFGHVRGSFSGAIGDRVGIFEAARGGTLFLDEIGELPLSLQPKLLRALELKEVRPVGSNTTRKVDVRVLAATNRSLATSVNEGRFREDLYYRLAVCELVLPPLRARREDIRVLAMLFHARAHGGEVELPPAFLASLAERSFPGNVRELRNVIERAAFLDWSHVSGTTVADGAPKPVPLIEGLVPLDLPMKEARAAWASRFEVLYVTALLRKAGGNVSYAAELGGVNRRYLHRLMAEHGIRRPDADADATEEAEDPDGT